MQDLTVIYLLDLLQRGLAAAKKMSPAALSIEIFNKRKKINFLSTKKKKEKIVS